MISYLKKITYIQFRIHLKMLLFVFYTFLRIVLKTNVVNVDEFSKNVI